MNELSTDASDSKIPVMPNGSNIGIGVYRAGTDPMTAIGLGSCVAIVLHDSRLCHGAMGHVMLPESNGKRDRPGKYADTAIELMLAEIMDLGSKKNSVIAKIAGGSSMFSNFQGKLNIGDRNVERIRQLLEGCGIPIMAEDVGGKVGRSVTYHPAEMGKVAVKRADGTCIEL